MQERVQKIIANAGFCSRRKAEELIEQGKVKVNGKKITLGDKADAFKDTITVDGKRIKLERHEYYLFHKPVRCLTTLSDPSRKKTIKEYIKGHNRLKPVGRLDYMTEGALILTSDGTFANRVAHPRYEIKKTYRVYTDKPVTEGQIKKLNTGLIVEGRKVQAHAKALTAHNNILDITIHEGRNRIIRKMMEILGVGIKQLVRIQIGPIKLANLPPGKMRKLTKEEIQYFQK
jgi:23S rRNA pseudouridine2605 synthase